MMEIFSAFLLSISSNLDNVLIGLSYGSRNKKIPIFYNVIIGTIIAFVTSLAVFFGDYIAGYISNSLASILGATTLIIIGIYNIFSLKNECNKDKDIKTISFKDSIVIAVSLSINNSIISLAGGISGVNKIATIFFTYIFSIAFLLIGNVLGRKVNTKVIGIITSLLLILLGIYEYIF